MNRCLADGPRFAQEASAMTRTRTRSEGGYTLIELMVVMCVIGILSGMAVLQIGSVRPGMQADGAMRMMMGQLNSAREIPSRSGVRSRSASSAPTRWTSPAAISPWATRC